MSRDEGEPATVLHRYVLLEAIASGGMATVHLGRLEGAGGFARSVAIKRLHAHLAADPEVATVLLDEARLAGAIRHPNVVPTLDVVQAGGELLMVMEYVDGESVAQLQQRAKARGEIVPPPIAAAIVGGTLAGLHAAHEARAEDGTALHIVHRDVSPQNILVGQNGIARLVDFGIARAAVRAQTTREGHVKGKLRYMAPEQLRGRRDVDRRVDVYAAGVVLWELLTGQRLFEGESDAEVFGKVLEGFVLPPSAITPLPAALDVVVMRALCRDPSGRFATAWDMADALAGALPVATAPVVGAWVAALVGDVITERQAMLRGHDRAENAELEGSPDDDDTTTRSIRVPPPVVGAQLPVSAHPSAEEEDRRSPGHEASGGARKRRSIPAGPPPNPTRTLTSPALIVASRPAQPAIRPVVLDLAAPRPDAAPESFADVARWGPTAQLPMHVPDVTVSHFAPVAPGRATRRAVTWIALGAALAIGAAGALGAAFLPSSDRGAPSSAGTKSSAESPSAAGTMLPTAPASAEAPVPPEPSAPASVSASASAAPKPAYCVPPYYVDKSGIRRVKRGCL